MFEGVVRCSSCGTSWALPWSSATARRHLEQYPGHKLEPAAVPPFSAEVVASGSSDVHVRAGLEASG